MLFRSQDPLPRIPVQRGPLIVTFDDDAQGWSGVDKAEVREGHLTVVRAAPLRPFAHGVPLPGDWPMILGGDAVTISARVRADKPGGGVRFEVHAGDIAGWSFEKLPGFSTDWQTTHTTLRYDWTDAEAREAGWMPSMQGFSWRETMRHVGKLVVMAGQAGSQARFDLDELRIEAKEQKRP